MKTWDAAGRPRQCPLFEYKKLMNAKYKHAVCSIRKNQQTMRADFLAEKLLSNNAADFWKEVRALNNSETSLTCTSEGISVADNIFEQWS